MDVKKTIGVLISTILLIGIVSGVVLVRRQLKTGGEAAGDLREDFNKNGKVDNEDFVIFRQKYVAKDPLADLDDSGEVNSLDYNLFLSKMK